MPNSPPHPHGLLLKLRGYIQGLGPYQSLVLLAVPTSIVEPLKLIAVAVAGEGGHEIGVRMVGQE